MNANIYMHKVNDVLYVTCVANPLNDHCELWTIDCITIYLLAFYLYCMSQVCTVLIMRCLCDRIYMNNWVRNEKALQRYGFDFALKACYSHDHPVFFSSRAKLKVARIWTNWVYRMVCCGLHLYDQLYMKYNLPLTLATKVVRPWADYFCGQPMAWLL